MQIPLCLAPYCKKWAKTVFVAHKKTSCGLY